MWPDGEDIFQIHELKIYEVMYTSISKKERTLVHINSSSGRTHIRITHDMNANLSANVKWWISPQFKDL